MPESGLAGRAATVAGAAGALGAGLVTPHAYHDSWPKIPDVAQAYLFLASPAAKLISGAAVPA